VAVIGGLIIVLATGWRWLDAVVALVFSIIIFMTGYKVLRRSLAGIMDEADVQLLEQVVGILQVHRRDAWIDLHNLRVIQYGSVLHIDAHMTLPYYFQVRQAEAEVDSLENLIREHFGTKVELFVHVDGCAPYQCKLCSVKDCPVRQEEMRERLIWNIDNVMTDSKHGKEADND
jgi:divalent metal cation (Fe/Co/Zn/Cd) transporter